jgi:hypothetical protein
MTNTKKSPLTRTLVDAAGATLAIRGLTLVMPIGLAASLFQTQAGPMALSLLAVGIVFGRYLSRTRRSGAAVSARIAALQPSAS